MFAEGKGRAWVNGDIQCTLYMYLMSGLSLKIDVVL